MIRMFLENSVLVLFFLPFIVGIYFLLNFQTGYYVQPTNPDFGLWSSFFSGNSWMNSFFSFGLIIINALSLNWVFNKNEFFKNVNKKKTAIFILFSKKIIKNIIRVE